MNTKSKTLFATMFVIALAAPAFADEPESLVNDPRNLTVNQPRDQVLIMQATPNFHGAPAYQAARPYRLQAPAPQYFYDGGQQDWIVDHAKGNVE
jgi:hypothetical protein